MTAVIVIFGILVIGNEILSECAVHGMAAIKDELEFVDSYYLVKIVCIGPISFYWSLFQVVGNVDCGPRHAVSRFRENFVIFVTDHVQR